MPCWNTITTTTATLADVKTMNRERLRAAAEANGASITFVGSSAELTTYSNTNSQALTDAVMRTYSEETVKAGLRSFGMKLKGRTEQQTTTGTSIKLKVGR